MSKRIFNVLVPAAAIVAFMAIPSLARATLVQCGGAECTNGATIKAQSVNLSLQAQSPHHQIISCTGSEFEGTLTENQKETIEGSVTKSVFAGCTIDNQIEAYTGDITTNASTGWKLQVQQPEGETSGQVTAHLDPASGKKIEITAIMQAFGFNVGTCVFSASTVQLMGTEQEDALTVEGGELFTLIERKGLTGGECGTVNTTKGDLTGSLQLETGSGSAVVAHGPPTKIQAQCGESECGNGTTIRGQGTNLSIAAQTPSGTIACTSSEFGGTLTANQVEEAMEGSITSSAFSGCTAYGIKADVSTNVGAGASAWKLDVQQPDETGQITAHLQPASGESLKFIVDVQVGEVSVATCIFSANSVQLMSTEQVDTLAIEGKEQFTLIERSGPGQNECGTVNTTKGDLTGSLQLENTNKEEVVVHGKPQPAPPSQAQCGGSECQNGRLIRGQTSEIEVALQGSESTAIRCGNSEFQGELTANQNKVIEGSIVKDVLTKCLIENPKGGASTIDMSTNASTGAPWRLQVQQPEGSKAGETSGQVTAHLDPAWGKAIELTGQVQEFGFSTATCKYLANTVRLMGTEQVDTLAVEGKEQFTLMSASGAGAATCGIVNATRGDLASSLQLETDEESPKAVVIHMN